MALTATQIDILKQNPELGHSIVDFINAYASSPGGVTWTAAGLLASLGGSTTAAGLAVPNNSTHALYIAALKQAVEDLD